MNLLGIANIFNQICQLHPDVNFFHYGWRSDANSNITNNFTPEGVRRWAAVHLDFPTEQTIIKQAGGQTVADCFLVIMLPQGRTNTGQGRADTAATIVEQHAAIKELGLSLLGSFNELARIQYINKLALVGDVSINYTAEWGAARQVVGFFNFKIRYMEDCPTTYTDLSQLPLNFQDLPASDSEDYEKLR